MMNKNWVLGLVGLLVVVGAATYFFLSGRGGNLLKPAEKPIVVKEEKLVIPETKEVTPAAGREVSSTAQVEVPLVPKSESEKVVVASAVLTVKGVVDKTGSEAKVWKSDAKLSFVKALATVTLEGKSSSWQAVYVSATAGADDGYEIIVEGESIVSKKAIPSTSRGADLPETYKDSPQAIAALAELPQFSDATISGLNFYYNADGKVWRYAVSTNKGTTSVQAE